MPGPANSKKKSKAQTKKAKLRQSTGHSAATTPTRHTVSTPEPRADNDAQLLSGPHDSQDGDRIYQDSPTLDPNIPVTYPTPLVQQIEESIPYEFRSTISIPTGSPLIPPTKGLTKTVERMLFQEPFIQDPGNGPRVRDIKAFMRSSFAQPPAWDVRMMGTRFCTLFNFMIIGNILIIGFILI